MANLGKLQPSNSLCYGSCKVGFGTLGGTYSIHPFSPSIVRFILFTHMSLRTRLVYNMTTPSLLETNKGDSPPYVDSTWAQKCTMLKLLAVDMPKDKHGEIPVSRSGT